MIINAVKGVLYLECVIEFVLKFIVWFGSEIRYKRAARNAFGSMWARDAVLLLRA